MISQPGQELVVGPAPHEEHEVTVFCRLGAAILAGRLLVLVLARLRPDASTRFAIDFQHTAAQPQFVRLRATRSAASPFGHRGLKLGVELVRELSESRRTSALPAELRVPGAGWTDTPRNEIAKEVEDSKLPILLNQQIRRPKPREYCHVAFPASIASIESPREALLSALIHSRWTGNPQRSKVRGSDSIQFADPSTIQVGAR